MFGKSPRNKANHGPATVHSAGFEDEHRLPLVASLCRAMPLRPGQFNEAALHLTEQRRRQRSDISRPAIDRSDIRTRPDKAVALGQDNPGTIVVEPEPVASSPAESRSRLLRCRAARE